MKSILIIDDSDDLLTLLKSSLESTYQVFTSNSGRKGLYTLLSNKPDVILLDIMMQGLNGYDLLKLLRNDELTKNTPIIIVSALVENEVIKKCKQMNANAFIKKPFPLNKLKKFIGEVVNNEIDFSTNFFVLNP